MAWVCSCGEGADLDEVVSEHAVSGPDPGAFGAVDAGAVPAVAAFEGADAAFAAGAPLDGSSEGGSVFFVSPGLICLCGLMHRLGRTPPVEFEAAYYAEHAAAETEAHQ